MIDRRFIRGGLSVQSNSRTNNDNVNLRCTSHARNWTLPRLLLANIRSLRHKTDELAVIMEINNIDICCTTESWLTKDTPTETVDIDGYVCCRRDRADGRQGGGVVVYVREDQPFTLLQPVDDSDDVESLWLLYRQPRMPRSRSHIIIQRCLPPARRRQSHHK